MAFRKNVNLRNAMANNFASLFNGGTVEIRTGSQPASAQDPATGTVLCTITLPVSAFTSASGGSVSRAGTWQGTAIAADAAGYARFSAAAGVFDVSVGLSGTDLIINDVNIVVGGLVTVTAFTFTEQA